jgi:hypothetical protein
MWKVSKVETCRHGHSRDNLWTTTPGGQRYCKDCASIRQGARRAKKGLVKDSKYEGTYDAKVRDTIANLEKRVVQLQKQIAKNKARLARLEKK